MNVASAEATPDPVDSHPMLTEVVLPDLVEPDGLVIQQRAVPSPSRGQALVQMQATGVSFPESARTWIRRSSAGESPRSPRPERGRRTP